MEAVFVNSKRPIKIVLKFLAATASMSNLAETYVRILVCGNEILRTNGRPQKLKLDLTKMKEDELTGSKLNK